MTTTLRVASTTSDREQSKRRISDFIQQIENELDDVLLQNTPDQWDYEVLDTIKDRVIRRTRSLLRTLDQRALILRSTLTTHTASAIADTRALISLRLLEDM